MSDDAKVHATLAQRLHRPLFQVHETGSLHERIFKTPDHLVRAVEESKARVRKLIEDGKLPSNQGVWWGLKVAPFDIRTIKNFQSSNVHHETCVLAKTAAICGLGFRTPGDKLLPAAPELGTPLTGPAAGNSAAPGGGEPVDEKDVVSEVLDEFCDVSFLDVLTSCIEDFVQVGNGYMEVVRGEDKTIKGLYHIPAEDVSIIIEDAQYNRHYQIITTESAGMRWFANFGDLDDFKRRIGAGSLQAIGLPPPDSGIPVSEVIHFRQPTSLNRWYGWPTWIAGTAAIELTQCLYQHNYDFFLNRGVPEFLLLLMGHMLDKNDWAKVDKAMQQNIGLGNSSKSVALNLPQELKVELHKLALEGKTDGGFQELHDPLALDIVSAHRVPHLLAGIQIPGKLGAANELPNALMAFQVLVCGPAQHTISKILSRTLGNPEKNGGLALKEKDFVFREIIDRIDIGKTDTMARMRQPVAQAQAQGRDLSEGLLKELVSKGMSEDDAVQHVLKLYAVALERVSMRAQKEAPQPIVINMPPLVLPAPAAPPTNNVSVNVEKESAAPGKVEHHTHNHTTVNVPERETKIENRSEVHVPERSVVTHVQAPAAPPVTVNVEVKGGNKKIEYKRDADGNVTGAVVEGK